MYTIQFSTRAGGKKKQVQSDKGRQQITYAGIKKSLSILSLQNTNDMCPNIIIKQRKQYTVLWGNVKEASTWCHSSANMAWQCY